MLMRSVSLNNLSNLVTRPPQAGGNGKKGVVLLVLLLQYAMLGIKACDG